MAETSRTGQRSGSRRTWLILGAVVLLVIVASSALFSPGPPATPTQPTPTAQATTAPTSLTAASTVAASFTPLSLEPTATFSQATVAEPTATPQPSPTDAPTLPPSSTSTPTLAPTATPTKTPLALIPAKLARVVDGDTMDFVIEGREERVRLIGVDTPETNGGPICYGQEATGKAAELIGSVGGNVLLEKDISETDRYGRLLRYVWLEDAAGRRMLDEELVLAGYAQVSTFPPDVKYADRFLAAERNARAAKRGLWGACDYFGAPIAQPVPTSIVVPPPSGGSGGEPSGGLLYDPNGPDRDCSDFSTHQQAQDFFLAAGGPARDPHRLDGDHDGIACETLP